jgi:hypothetical protein
MAIWKIFPQLQYLKVSAERLKTFYLRFINLHYLRICFSADFTFSSSFNTTSLNLSFLSFTCEHKLCHELCCTTNEVWPVSHFQKDCDIIILWNAWHTRLTLQKWWGNLSSSVFKRPPSKRVPHPNSMCLLFPSSERHLTSRQYISW